MIRAESIEKRYGTTGPMVLSGVSFEVPQGKLCAILGGSGAGKSTLLRILVGLESFWAGTLTIDDVTVKGESAAPLAEVRAAIARLHGMVGLVFQSFELFPHLSVLANCVLAPRLVKQVDRATAEQTAHGHLESLGLSAFADKFPEQLSGGQRQRVAIARALCMAPKLLCYDEPTSALDPALRKEVEAMLRRIGQGGMTQIVVTHDHDLARGCDWVIKLDKGKVAAAGPPADVVGA